MAPSEVNTFISKETLDHRDLSIMCSAFPTSPYSDCPFFFTGGSLDKLWIKSLKKPYAQVPNDVTHHNVVHKHAKSPQSAKKTMK